jgi:drug/metabolite transporter (DMT)-like permease
MKGGAGHVLNSEREVVIGILLMIVATQVQPMMDAVAKWLGGQMSPLQVAWGRMFFQMLLTLPVVLWLYGAVGLLPRPIGLQLLRGFFLSGMNVTFFFAIAKMPIADAIALVFVAPMIVTALSAIILGEHVGPRRWTAVAVGLCGALIVIRPGGGAFGSIGLLPLGTAFFYAGYLIVTRRLTSSSQPMQIHFFTALTSMVILACPLAVGAALDLAPIVPIMPTVTQWSLLVLIGLLSWIAHLLIILAYSRAPASVLAPIGYLEIVGATAIGFAVFGDFPDGWTWVGVAVIISSGMYILLHERSHGVSARMHGRRTAGR